MSAQSIIQTLKQLIDLHKELNEMARDKTEAIKAEELNLLSSLLVQERKLVVEIEKLEKVRQSDVHTFLREKGVQDESALLSECIQYAAENEQTELNKLGVELREEITKLKERNELNQQLIYQSLQFVNMNINLMLPETENYTYERPQDSEGERSRGQSLFDSKA